MDDNQRLQLQKMINENDVLDQTELIRNLKHSTILANEINNLVMLKAKYRNDPEKIHYEGINECNFLFTYYTDIYNKVRKDEIDLTILNKFLNVLQKIEDGEMNQHEGSFLVGSLLKEMYVDSALKTKAKIETQERNRKIKNKPPKANIKNISYKEFKLLQEH